MTATATKSPPAYFGDPAVKERALAEMRGHIEAGHLIKRTYGVMSPDGFRGCMIGCLGGEETHRGVSRKFGLPVDLCQLFDSTFEGLPDPANRAFTVEVLAAIPAGADLETVLPRFLRWLLTCPELDLAGKADDAGKAAIAAVADLCRRALEGDKPSPEEWYAARSAAGSAAEVAAWSAARSAWSAARSAAEAAARSAAEAAARSAAEAAARSAAGYAAWEAIAAELIRLLAASGPSPIR